MAKKKTGIRRTTIEEPIEDLDAISEDTSLPGPLPETYESFDEIDEALSDLAPDTKGIYFYRIAERGRPKFLDMLEVGAFSPQAFKDLYGGGRYRYRAKKKDGSVKAGYFEIDGEPRTPPISVSVPTAPSGMTGLSQQILDRLDRLESRLHAPQSEALTEKLLMALLARPDSEAAFLSKLSLYKDLFSGGGGDTGIGKSLLDTIKELAPILAGGEVSPWLMALEKLGPVVEKLAGSLTTPRVQPGASVPRERLQAPSPETKPMPTPKDPSLPEELVRPYIPMFLIAATRDADPMPYVQIVMDQCPPEKKAELEAWLKTEKWWADLVALDNRIGLQAAWWGELRDLLTDVLAGREPGGATDHEPTDAKTEG